ncbi:Protein GAMETE EXPRESSED 2 [Dichanthelium oligosanthes]|uniref:Protein GAMETE EXPRESSED 2 n=1 Tax=Dichanthelium oligosanthes TaxID=888268 RepID=A0A1E5VYG2_9POAL|nr:Protein GAMETE EXPRESSED 2 [Dichanthelium oligosanthes]
MANPAAISLRSSALSLSLLLCISLLTSSLAQQQGPVPAFLFDWLEGKSAFIAGDTAAITVRPLDLPDGASLRSLLSFWVSVNGKKGNSTYITDVAVHLGDDPSTWKITFVPLRAGDFVALVAEARLSVGESSLQFTVAAAGVHPSASRASWTFDDGAHVVAGTRAFVSVFPRDAFGNGVARGDDLPGYFKVSGSYVNGSAVEFLNFYYNGWIQDGRIGLEFVATVAGDFLVHVYGDNRELRDSPLMLTVNPGLLNIAKSTCSWKHGTNNLQIFSKLEIFIHQKDSFGNIVPEIHPFDAQVVDAASNLSFPVALLMEAVADGVQLLSFNLVQPGEFVLTVFYAQLNQRVSNTVYKFDVFVGYCNGSNSFANGSGLAHSVAGLKSSFAVFLEDQYSNPSPVETARLQVKILAKNGTSYAGPIISHGNAIISGNSAQASQFSVSYTPQIAGEYEIWVLCGNIVLNGGNPYAMTVLPGLANSLVYLFYQSFHIHLISASITTPITTTSFVPKEFVDNRDGSYTGRYVARYLGSYGICVLFEDKQLAPCPFEVNVLADDYFSDVQNDSVSVWEAESVSFDVLSNDHIAGSKAEISNSSSSIHGSVLQFNHIYRYTPFEGFFGNDSFSYTISDEHNNVVTATVFISVLCKPPQFISLAQKLHVTEDTIGPQFGGFPGIKIIYSDITENISVTVKPQSGNVFLSLMPMKLHQSSADVLSISRGGRAGKDLILQGTIEAINGALQFLQYIGNKDFYGNDVIALHAMSRNGVEDTQFPIFVEPINDHPVILAPRSISLGGNESREGHQIYDKSRDTFRFSIVEPDLRNFPGNKSHFSVMLSLEVFEGTLTLSLPASTIPTVELKIEGVNHWQPLQTYVIIENHFVMKGTAIRFRGMVQDCNNAMQQLHYQGPSNGTTLSITVNDLGNYGCYPDCSKMMGSPLSAAKTVSLVKTKIKTKQKNPRIDRLVGSLVAIEILTMLCLGITLLYFLFKCIKALRVERRGRIHNERRTPEQTPSQRHRGASPSQSEDFGHCSAPAAGFPSGANRSSFRQRSSWSRKQELELQPVSGIRNNGNPDGITLTDKDE